MKYVSAPCGLIEEMASDTPFDDQVADNGDKASRRTKAQPTVPVFAGKDAAVVEGATKRLQRWWRSCMKAQEALVECLVKELMHLRHEAAFEVQEAWREHARRRRLAQGANSKR